MQAKRHTISDARAAAFHILLRVERDASYASELLNSKTYAALAPSDHSLATQITMGVLRWRSLLDSEIFTISSQKPEKLDLEVLTALRMAVYQMHWLDRIPPHAAISQSVELVKRARKRSAAPFINAVLRKMRAQSETHARSDGGTDSSSISHLAASCAHPLWLVERWNRQYGLEITRKICRHDQSVPVTNIRLRTPEAESNLIAQGIELAPGALIAWARIVKNGNVTKTAAFRNRQCVIQDEASQLVAALIGGSEHLLDCCAAPGGKSFAFADRNPGSRTIAVDLHPHRVRLLSSLNSAQARDGHPLSGKIQIVAADAVELPFTNAFERVLADVPCSGTGTLARNPEIKWRLTQADIADLKQRQLAILLSAMRRVSRGGRLIYSTCSLESEENEEVVESALSQEPAFRVVDAALELQRLRGEKELVWSDPASLTRRQYLRTIPGLHPCDGFFAAILERI